jgi:hypothetical protein
MTVAFWLPPVVKVVSTGLIVVCASVFAEALGPFWGALIASLPVSAGPAYVFLAMQHEADFVAASALGSLAANAATGLFLIVYSALAGRTSPVKSLGAAVLAWLVASFAVHSVAWSPITALLLNLVVYGVGFALPDAAGGRHTAAATSTSRRWLELPLRAAAVAGFVSLIVAISSVLGPAATGIAAVFPVSLISLIVIVRPRIGGWASALLATNAMRAMLGFGMMLLTLHLAIRPLGVVAALIFALSVSGAWSIGLLFLRQWGRSGSGHDGRVSTSGDAATSVARTPPAGSPARDTGVIRAPAPSH